MASDLPNAVPTDGVGPNLRQLDIVWREAGRLDMQLAIDPDGNEVEYVLIFLRGWGQTVRGDATPLHQCQAETPSGVLLEVAGRCPTAELCLESLSIHLGSQRSRKGLTELAIAAWHEAFDRPVPTPTERKARQQACRERLLAMLRGGPEGVARWNELRNETLLKAGHFRRIDLSGCDLRGAKLRTHHGLSLGGLDFERANFDRAALTGSDLSKTLLPRANFREAILDKADLIRADLVEADFGGAALKKCDLRGAKCGKATFRHADLTGADLRETDLRGANLSSAVLADARFKNTQHDADTRFPPGFTMTEYQSRKPEGVQVSDRLRVTEGAFANFEGEVTNIDDATGKLTLRIRVLGRDCPVELTFDQVESV